MGVNETTGFRFVIGQGKECCMATKTENFQKIKAKIRLAKCCSHIQRQMEGSESGRAR